MIRDETLPGTLERFAQANRAASRLTATGYVRVGLDHFARPGDALVRGSVQRNFQGYTTDDASSLIGFGASAIGRFADGFVQNVTAVGDYSRRVDVDGLAVARGRRLTSDDKARGFVIARLLCDLQLSVSDVAAKFGAAAEVIGDIGLALIDADEDGLVEAIGTDGSFQVTEKGRLFLRSIAACFDAYLGTAPARHAAGV
jgi:oxygen-independent coproporphyrinogen-3 oxidase